MLWFSTKCLPTLRWSSTSPMPVSSCWNWWPFCLALSDIGPGIRNFWFRLVHVLMMGAVAAETYCGIPCPLTVWEKPIADPRG